VDAKPCTFQITFTPSAAGTRNGTITFTDNATGSPQTVTLTGTGVAVAIGISPTSLTFGSQAVGTTSAAQTVTVSNNGNFPLIFSNIVTSGDFAGATLAQCPSIGVEAQPCVFSITFKPTATGTRAGAITFTDTGTGSPQTVTLSGTGTPGTATVTVTPSSLTFGSQAVSTSSAPLSVTVTNTGTAAVNFTGFTTSGPDAEDFGVPLPNSNTGCSPTGTLAAGASCTINVVFTPQAAGARTVTLLIADNATGSPQLVALSGTGATSSVIITVAPGGSTTATTVSGGTAYYGLMISGAPGVTGTVQLGCVPSSILITCKVIPGSLTLNGGSTEVAFAIQTFCQGTTTATGFVAPIVGGNGGGLGLLLVTMVFGGAVWTYRRNRRVALTFATLLLVALGSAACNSLPSGPNGATPAGTYTLSLTTSLNGGPPQTLNNFLTLVVK
jgi:Abnormal spindle-like microcephaly-assoc'd, ASPM-SPD-2-Hydin